MNEALLNSIAETFKSTFNNSPLLVFSPGRINLIGEHTDYNNGFVFPAAINKGIYLAIGRSSDQSKVIAVDVNESHTFSIEEDLRPVPDGGWRNYLMGVLHQIKTSGRIIGEINIVFGGDIPIGSGLSSSAALENSVGYGINALFRLDISKMDLLKMSQKAEHDFAGVRCGIMDQFASMMGEKDKAILLDCESLYYSAYPLELDDYTLLLFNSNVEHNLAGSEYNVRRAQCEEGVSLLQKHYSNVASLRDATLEMIELHKDEFDPVVYKRCKYVLEENQRVLSFGEYLKDGDVVSAGRLLYEGHEGMKSDYEITCQELDFMVDFTKEKDGILGARMMGGGFGGCTINLVKRDIVGEFMTELSAAYKLKWGIDLTPIEVEISRGAGLITDFQ